MHKCCGVDNPVSPFLLES